MLAVRDEARATREKIRSIGSALRVRDRGDYIFEWDFQMLPTKRDVCLVLSALCLGYLNATGNKDQGYYRLYRLLLPALKIGLRVRRRDHFFGVQHIFFW